MAGRWWQADDDRQKATDREKHIDRDSRGRQVDGDRSVCSHSQTNSEACYFADLIQPKKQKIHERYRMIKMKTQ